MNTPTPGRIRDAAQPGPRLLSRVPAPGADPCARRILPARRSQAGSMLLESFIAILIFSMGILAIVGMQASAIKHSADAKYRSEASMLANELLGKMWVALDRTGTTAAQFTAAQVAMQTNFQGGAGTDGAGYTAWFSEVQATLPDSSAYAPTVTINPANGLVTITVLWKPPNEPTAAAPRSYLVLAQIR